MSDFKPTHTIGEGGPECFIEAGYEDVDRPNVVLDNGAVVECVIESLIPITPPVPAVEPKWIEMKECRGRPNFWTTNKLHPNPTGRTLKILDPASVPTVEELAEMGLLAHVLFDSGRHRGFVFKFRGDTKNRNQYPTLDEARIGAAEWLAEHKPEAWREWREKQ